eukprot:GHVQ01015878.1.p1 GENE.GHVQ01015878.1~~GHVQ01015878.1.p1  ORF type:complete len:1082 (+),score=123.11 GHVQ01015878.1:237-3482(+)
MDAPDLLPLSHPKTSPHLSELFPYHQESAGLRRIPPSPEFLLLSGVVTSDLSKVTKAIESNADVNCYVQLEPETSRTPLRMAATSGSPEIASLLLSSGAQVFAHSEKDNWTALHSAAESGKEDVLRLLISASEDATKGFNGFTLLMIGCEILSRNLPNGGTDFLRYLLKHKQHTVNDQSNRPGFLGWTALHICSLRGKQKCANLLLSSGANHAARTGDFSIVGNEHLNRDISNGAPALLSVTNSSQRTGEEHDRGLLPLHLACLRGHAQMVKSLACNSTPLNCGRELLTEEFKWTPLHCAVYGGNNRLVVELCRRGARSHIHRMTSGGEQQHTPLTLAVSRGHTDVVRTLLAFGADPTQRIRLSFPGTEFSVTKEDNWVGFEDNVNSLHVSILKGDSRLFESLLCDAVHPGAKTASCVRRQAVPKHQRNSPAPQASAHNLRIKRRESPDAMFQVTGRGFSLLQLSLLAAGARRCYASCGSSSPDYSTTSLQWKLIKYVEFTVQLERYAGTAICIYGLYPETNVAVIEGMRNDRDEIEERQAIVKQVLQAGFESSTNWSDGDISPWIERMSNDVILGYVNALGAACQENPRWLQVFFQAAHLTFVAACAHAKLKAVQGLISQGLVDINCPFIQPISMRPLHLSCTLGYGTLAQMLISAGGSASESDELGYKPIEKLCYALSSSNMPESAADPSGRCLFLSPIFYESSKKQNLETKKEPTGIFRYSYTMGSGIQTKCSELLFSSTSGNEQRFKCCTPGNFEIAAVGSEEPSADSSNKQTREDGLQPKLASDLPDCPVLVPYGDRYIGSGSVSDEFSQRDDGFSRGTESKTRVYRIEVEALILSPCPRYASDCPFVISSGAASCEFQLTTESLQVGSGGDLSNDVLSAPQQFCCSSYSSETRLPNVPTILRSSTPATNQSTSLTLSSAPVVSAPVVSVPVVSAPVVSTCLCESTSFRPSNVRSVCSTPLTSFRPPGPSQANPSCPEVPAFSMCGPGLQQLAARADCGASGHIDKEDEPEHKSDLCTGGRIPNQTEALHKSKSGVSIRPITHLQYSSSGRRLRTSVMSRQSARHGKYHRMLLQHT